ncbi:hypothetical protein Holit_02502 [Hollandina sp. SP2]
MVRATKTVVGLTPFMRFYLRHIWGRGQCFALPVPNRIQRMVSAFTIRTPWKDREKSTEITALPTLFQILVLICTYGQSGRMNEPEYWAYFEKIGMTAAGADRASKDPIKSRMKQMARSNAYFESCFFIRHLCLKPHLSCFHLNVYTPALGISG